MKRGSHLVWEQGEKEVKRNKENWERPGMEKSTGLGEEGDGDLEVQTSG